VKNYGRMPRAGPMGPGRRKPTSRQRQPAGPGQPEPHRPPPLPIISPSVCLRAGLFPLGNPGCQAFGPEQAPSTDFHARQSLLDQAINRSCGNVQHRRRLPGVHQKPGFIAVHLFCHGVVLRCEENPRNTGKRRLAVKAECSLSMQQFSLK